MKNQKISMKLCIGFGAILVMFIISVIWGAVSLRSIAQNLDAFYVKPFANVREVLQADRESEAAAKYMLRAALEKDPSVVEEMLRLAQERLDLMDGYAEFLMTNYSGNTNDISGLQNEIDSMDAILAEYEDICRSNNVEAAYSLYTAKVVGLLTDITNSVNAITSQANQYAMETHDSGMSSSTITIVIMVVIGVLAVVVGTVLALYITKSITSAIVQLEIAAKKMSEGDFDVNINYQSKDELGVLSDAMRSTIATLKVVIQDIGNMLDEMAGGNLTIRTREESSYKGELRPILLAIRKMRDDLNSWPAAASLSPRAPQSRRLLSRSWPLQSTTSASRWRTLRSTPRSPRRKMRSPMSRSRSAPSIWRSSCAPWRISSPSPRRSGR